jgi:predicted ribosome quality control (RQC) complex YloA/Tae2 family protein
MDSIPPKASSFVYEGEEIKLDPSRSAAENANAYYKRAKKAKMTLKQVDISKEKASKELEEITSSLTQLEHADEAGLEMMAKELDMAIVNQAKKKGAHEWRGLSVSSLPYYVEYEGTKILYGKTSKHNDCLTFLFETAKDHLWFHVMGNSGSHVIIKKDDPTEEEINLAASIALLNSKQEEGEVMMAYRKDVRKGSVPGQAVVKTFKTLRLNNIDLKARDLLESAKRYSF